MRKHLPFFNPQTFGCPMLTLYYSAGACSLAPHIVLEETGLPYQAISAPTKTKQLPDGSDFRRINPLGYVPYLVLDDGSGLGECAVILQYLADQAPDKKLIPACGSLARYQTQSWLHFIATELHKGFSPLFNPAMPDEGKQVSKARLLDRLKWMDSQLPEQGWLTGADFSVADAYLFTVSNWAAPMSIDLSPFPRLMAWRERVAARPAVQAAMKAEGLV